jgi:hypothetical protein
MSQFNYTLPSGSEFVVRGPAGATQAQADRIFYEQVAAGSLVGYESGQTLTSTATQITKFELSRLDRGTAGVDTPTVLAVVQGLPVLAGIPNLSIVPLTNPINEGDIVAIKGDDFAPGSVGPLNSFQVQKLLAQVANLVAQESDQISLNKGIGRYGFTAYALEEAGYVKPGTSLRFFAVDPEDFVTVMSSPSVWTGRDGVYGLSDLLSDALLQNRVQVQLMQQGYEQLEQSGVISQTRTPSVQLSSGQVYTTGGLQSIQALTAASVFEGLDRLTNAGLTRGVLQNIQSPGTVLNRLFNVPNINLNTIGSGAINSLTAGVGNLGNLANLNFASIGSNLTNQITGSIGGLVANASKFGSQATALWAQAGNLNFNNISGSLTNFVGTNLNNLAGGLTSGITSNLNNLAGGLAGNLSNITSNLTNLLPGNLSNLTSNLDIFGKAGSFATNFANPLGNLNSLSGAITGQLGQLSGAVTGQLGQLSGQLTGAVTGQLGQLSGQLTGAVTGQLGALSGQLTGALGNFANIGAVGDLFGGGGDLVSGTAAAGGFNNTVNRATVDAAFARVVGSSKIPLPTFQYPSLAALAPRLDIQQAQNFLQNQLRGATASIGQAVSGQVTGAARSLFG